MRSLLLSILLFALSLPLLGAAPQDEMLENYFAQYVYVMNSPVFVYHWFQGGNIHPVKSSDRKGFDYLKDQSSLFWKTGKAFDLAVDPISSRKLGGSENWNLIQLRMTSGFRVLDFRQGKETRFPAAIQELLVQQGCPASFNQIDKLPEVVVLGKKSCVDALRRVLSDDLSIDAFAGTPLGGTRTSECSSISKNTAFTLASIKHFTPEDVKLFNEHTLDSVEDRVRIQSLFYKADYDTNFTAGPSDPLFPTLITRLNPPFSGGVLHLLWEDLDEKAIDPNIGSCPPRSPASQPSALDSNP
jgi:hypothetical protein